MRIAWIIERMDPARGGRETSTAQVTSTLARRGHDVTVLCQSGSWNDLRVRVHPLGRRGVGRRARLRGFVRDVCLAVEAERFDVVHATLPVPCATVYQPRGGTIPGLLAAHRRRWGLLGGVRRHVLDRLNAARRLLGRLEAKLVERPDVLCAPPSQMVARELRDYYGRTEGVRVVFNGVAAPPADSEQRAHWRQSRRYRLRVGRDVPLLLTVARNWELKGVREALAAFARWSHGPGAGREAVLAAVGKEDPQRYRQIAGMQDVGRRFVAEAPPENIWEWYAAADACILLSWYDPCSRVVLEAMRWGIPAITTAFNGAAEALADGAGVVVASPRDRRAVVEAIDTLADPDRRAAAAEVCRQRADWLSAERHADELLAVYEEAAGIRHG